MRKITLVLVLMLSCVAFGANSTTGPQPSALCDGILTGSSEQLAHLYFANYVANVEDSLGVRGFFGEAIPNTPENIEIAMKYGLLWWGMKWNFASSLEEAIEHRLKARRLHEAKGTPYTDVISAGQYIIGSEDELGLEFKDKELKHPVPVEKARHMFSRGAYEIDHLGNVKEVTTEQLQRRVSMNNLLFHKSGDLPGAFGKNSITQSGWVAFKQHGIHDYSTWKDSKEANKIRKAAQDMANAGYTVRFNLDYKWMLTKIKKQKRSYREQEVGEDGSLVKGERKEHLAGRSRYDTDSVFNSMLALLEAGKGYSVGVYDGRGELVAGEIGIRDGNHLYGDSVFYDDVMHAKVAALALFDTLDSMGMPYSDPGMITAYTASMGAELIPFTEYLTKIKGGPKERIELPAQWDPRSAERLDVAMNEVVKRKSQGLGNLKFTRRTPIVTGDDATAAAERAGLQHAWLNLIFVADGEQATQHVVGAAWADMPIYIEGISPEFMRLARGIQPAKNPDQYGPTLSASQFLLNALTGPDAAGVKAYFIGSARHPEVRKEIPLKQLLEVLELKILADPPQWTNDGQMPSITVNGWGFKPAAR